MIKWITNICFLGPRGPLRTPSFARPPVRPRQKSRSHLKPYKSSQDHARPLIWYIAVKRVMSSIIRWWRIQRQRQRQRQTYMESSTALLYVWDKDAGPCCLVASLYDHDPQALRWSYYNNHHHSFHTNTSTITNNPTITITNTSRMRMIRI